MKKIYFLLSLTLLISLQIDAQSKGVISGDLCDYSDNSCNNRTDFTQITMPNNGNLKFSGVINARQPPCGGEISYYGVFTIKIKYQDQNGNDRVFNLGSLTTQNSPNIDYETTDGFLKGTVIDIEIGMSGINPCALLDYNINWEVKNTTYNDDLLPNENAEQAINISENTSYQGNVGFFEYDGVFERDIDWYKITIPENEDLNIDVQSDYTITGFFETNLEILASYADGTPNFTSVKNISAYNTSNGTFDTKIPCVQQGILYI